MCRTRRRLLPHPSPQPSHRPCIALHLPCHRSLLAVFRRRAAPSPDRRRR
uniref:Uncharacterized protein n=1 Tax=Arundo donax TaxID=35708 RepID=A0A0A9EV52_ARUDO